MSKWSDTIEYINSFPIAYHFTPKEIINRMDGSPDSTSIYINYLHKAGYFVRISRGVYIKTRPIPPDLTIEKLKKFVYPKGKNWKERKQMIERYWKIKDLIGKV